MKYIVKIIGCILLLMPTACTNDDAPATQPDNWPVRFAPGFADDEITRATTAPDFTTSWDVGDFIYVDARIANTPWFYTLTQKFNGNTWVKVETPANAQYYPNDVSTGFTFSAYSIGGAGIVVPDADYIEHTVEQDQNEIYNEHLDGFKKSDLLLATTIIPKKQSEPVPLQFRHAMAMIQIELASDQEALPLGKDIDVYINNILAEVTFNKPNYDYTVNPNSFLTIRMKKVEGMDYTYRALVPPQVVTDKAVVNIIRTTPGSEIDMKYYGLVGKRLELGKVEKHKITLDWGTDPAHQYSVGDVYPHIGPPIGVVFWIDPASSGQHGKIVGLDQADGLPWADESSLTGANNSSNSMVNMKAISDYIKANNKSWSNFPAFEWVHNKNRVAEDYNDTGAKGIWYIPVQKELHTLNRVKSTVNANLWAAGGTGIGYAESIWLSEEFNAESIIGYGGYTIPKTATDMNTRCIMAF